MLLAQHCFYQRQRLSMNLLSLFIIALTAQHQCQIVYAPQRIRMLLAQHRFHQRQHLSINLLSLFVIALTTQHVGQIVYAS